MPRHSHHHQQQHRQQQHRHSALAPDPTVVENVVGIGRQRGLSDDHILTALIVGLQESRLNNLDHGHGSSVGWRQEVHRYYGSVANRMNVPASVGRFYDELARTPRRGATLGHWGQAVQRSAYPDAYDPHIAEARTILQNYDTAHRATATR